MNGWFIPVAGSNDGKVYTYTGNAPGFVANPFGGDQFMGQVTDHVNSTLGFSRAQHLITFTNTTWTFTFDFNANDTAAPPANDNIGSFSLQPSATNNYFQTLYTWVDINNPTTFNAWYGVDNTGLGVTGGFTTFYQPIDPAWQNLPVNHWYRSSITVDFTTNAVKEISMQDLTTGSSVTTVNPTDWYLSGGLNNVLAQPQATAFRCFSGGAIDGNVMGWDNMHIVPPPAVLAPTGFTVGLGSVISGNTASLAADDANPLKLCKAFVPNFASPRMRFDADFLSPYLTPSAVSLQLKSRMTTGGAFKVRAFIADRNAAGAGTYTYGVANQVVADTTINLTGTTPAILNGASTNVANNVHTDGTMRSRVEIQQTGFSAVFVPCSEFEFINLTVNP